MLKIIANLQKYKIWRLHDRFETLKIISIHFIGDHPKFFKEFDVYKRGILPRLPIIVKFDKNIT